MLELLSTRLAQGRIYARDLPALVPVINRLVDVTERRIREWESPHVCNVDAITYVRLTDSRLLG